MREFLTWACVLLALPACSSFEAAIPPADPTKPDPGTNLVRGAEPRDRAIFCDIARERRCATASDLQFGIPLADAAVALDAGRNSAGNIALDYSLDARNACGGGPQAIVFHGPYPTGTQVCLNCSVIGSGAPYPTPLEACRAQCQDLVFGPPAPDGSVRAVVPPSPDTIASCIAGTRVSTNVSAECSGILCTRDGSAPLSAIDPRRLAQAVNWVDRIGVATVAGSPTDLIGRLTEPTGNFDAAAVSAQWINGGNAWVELSLSRTDRAVTFGLSEKPSGAENDPGRDNIHFGLAFGPDGLVYVRVKGLVIAPPGFESWGPYAVGEKFRISVRENPPVLIGLTNATVSFARVPAGCAPGADCPIVPFYTHETASAEYPMRVKVSFRDRDVLVGDTRMVYIR